MTATFDKIPEYDFDDEGYPFESGHHFVVYVNGKFFCSTRSEIFAGSIVEYFNMYAKNKKQEEIIRYIKLIIEDEKRFFDFIAKIRREYIEKEQLEESKKQNQDLVC
ncbi:MAG: hypothetical protein EOM56_12070 [Deltaproteobacteria bacterium]|nr:hypothetical protein [Deltaproteobacteria bacterium]